MNTYFKPYISNNYTKQYPLNETFTFQFIVHKQNIIIKINANIKPIAHKISRSSNKPAINRDNIACVYSDKHHNIIFIYYRRVTPHR